MKTSILSLALTLTLTTAIAQWGQNKINLSSNITTETKDNTGFDKIEVSEDFNVYIRVADKEEIRIKANENLHNLIQVEQIGTTLKIYTDPYSASYNNRKKKSAKEVLTAYITVKELSEIVGDEDVNILVDGIVKAEELTIKLSEDCTLEGNFQVKNLYVNMDEDCTLDISGSAKNMEVKADEDCEIFGKKFTVQDLAVNLNEDSTAKLIVNGDIDLVAREDSYFSYRGTGRFVKKKLREDSEIGTW